MGNVCTALWAVGISFLILEGPAGSCVSAGSILIFLGPAGSCVAAGSVLASKGEGVGAVPGTGI
jgi:hypothetical protein